MVPGQESVAFLVDSDYSLRELETMILEEAGYTVVPISPDADIVADAAVRQPTVIVLHVGSDEYRDWEIVDHLFADPRTRQIPVVVISLFERLAAEAAAAPIVREVVIAPYDIQALIDAAAKAQERPAPSVFLPEPTRSTPEPVQAATLLLAKNARRIVLRTLERLGRSDSFDASYHQMTPSKINNLPLVLAAMIEGLERDLSARDLFTIPRIQAYAVEHTTLRKMAGAGISEILFEYNVLRDEIIGCLHENVWQGYLSYEDAQTTARQVDAYSDYLIELAVTAINSSRLDHDVALATW